MCIIKQTEEVETFAKTISIITALALLIVVIFSAGLRYHTEKDYKTLFAEPKATEEVSFPAVTLCPLSPAGVPGLSNTYWMARTFPNSDFLPNQQLVNTKSLLYRGEVITCLQYNWDATTFNSAQSVQSALVIRFMQNLDGLDPYTMTGAVGILHDQNEEPQFQDSPMFYAPLAQTTQVSVLNYYVRNTKRELTNHFYVAVPALVSGHVNSTTPDVGQVIIAYNQYGYYIQSQYHVYTTWMWIGEVGGAAALIYFLQHGLVWMAVGCARRTCLKKERKIRKDAELAAELQNQETESAAADSASQAAIYADATNNTTQQQSRKRRRPNNQQEASNEEEMETVIAAPSGSSNKPKTKRTKPRSPHASQDRLVIDVDSLAEDSE